MATCPKLEDFASYAEVVEAFGTASRQCVWYKPKPVPGSRCGVQTSCDDVKRSFKLLRALWKEACIQPGLVLEALRYVVQWACCDEYHRDMVRNKGLDEQLACNWRQEMLRHPSCAPQSVGTNTAIKTEHGERSEHVSVTSVLAVMLENIRERDTDFRFREMKKPPDENVASKMRDRISDKDVAVGHIYLFTQKTLPGMVKLGYTGKKVADRLRFWSKCGHGMPDLIRSFADVAYPKRVETLIHFELLSSWRRERHCEEHKSSHIEWFEIDRETAGIVAERWVSWVKLAQPYDQVGDLTERWKSIVDVLDLQGILITSKMLLDLHDLTDEDAEL